MHVLWYCFDLEITFVYNVIYDIINVIKINVKGNEHLVCNNHIRDNITQLQIVHFVYKIHGLYHSHSTVIEAC
jgi:hypothetical protein